MTTPSIKVGDAVPKGTLYTSSNPGDPDACALPQKLNTEDFLKNKKVVIFNVPAAFSPTCQNNHVPGFLAKLQDLKSKGVDAILCTSADSVFTQDAWGKKLGVGTNIVMASDPYGAWAEKMGLKYETHDGRVPMGPRSFRFALVADNGIVKYIGVDKQGLADSSAEAVLAHL
ncbi:hypothetical protein HK104_006310 [Borealophlyctis nickersoniae]|nr:hypothetical protein HK104_006310 [Borealophlyctis nickersoniae]